MVAETQANAEVPNKVQPEVTAVDLDTIVAAPDTIARLSGRIDDKLAEKLYMIASTAKNGASTGTVYPAREDETFKKDARRLRMHLASRLDLEVKRVAILPYVSGTGISFSVAIRDKVKRKAKTE